MDRDVSIIDLTKSTWRPEWSAWNILVTLQIKKQFSQILSKRSFFVLFVGALIHWFPFSSKFATTCASELWMLTLPLDLCQHFRGPRCATSSVHPVIAGPPGATRCFPREKPRAVSRHCGVENACFGVDATVWTCSASPTKEAKKELRQQENGNKKKRHKLWTLEDVHTVWLGWVEYEYASFLPVIGI